MLPFLCIPRVPNCMENLKGSWKFSFPKLFDSYRDSFLTAIVCNFRTFVGLFIFVIRYGSNHEMEIKRFQLFLLAKKTGKCAWYAHTFPPIWRIEVEDWNWAPLGEMINFGSFAQRNALDQWSNDPSLDHADQWTDESLSRVDLIDHWSENGFARKERHRSEILIRILPKEHSLKVEIYCFIWWSCLDKVRRLSYHFTLLHTSLTILPTTSSNIEFCFDFVVNTEMSVSLR